MADLAVLVRLLRLDGRMRRRQDFRVICDCQRHALRERSLWRRGLRVARRRGVAIAVGLPIACFALGFPIEAMNTKESARALLFASSPMTNAFFPPPTVRPMTFEQSKEQFFVHEVPYGPIIYRE